MLPSVTKSAPATDCCRLLCRLRLLCVLLLNPSVCFTCFHVHVFCYHCMVSVCAVRASKAVCIQRCSAFNWPTHVLLLPRVASPFLCLLVILRKRHMLYTHTIGATEQGEHGLFGTQ
jgi:hypothetical protein